MTTESIIRMEAVNKWYGEFQVLTGIDLSVRQGERIVICGPSGSGKSTLIRCINRLETVQKGRIVVDGIDLTAGGKNVDAVRAEVGMVFQQFNLFPHLTILENCTLAPMRSRGMTRAQAEEVAMKYLARVRIPEQAHKYPSQLSGGQQQRVAIARALCMSPKIMLFDEPTSAAPKDDREIRTEKDIQCAWWELRIWPRNCRVLSSLGLPKNSAGGACSTILPSAMKITRSATLRAKPISCVTHSMVMPSSARPIMVSSTSLTISGSSADVGSSNSIIRGPMHSERAIATRCCWPPDSWPGYFSACSGMRTRSR